MVAEGSDIHIWDSHSGAVEGERFFLLQRVGGDGRGEQAQLVGIGGKVEFRQGQRADRLGGRAGKGEGKDGEHRLAGIAVC